MIPAALLRYLPHALALIAVLWLGLVIHGWKQDSERLKVVDKEFAVYRTGVETGVRVRKEVSDEYQGELSQLRADAAAAPARTVRLCSSPAVRTTGTTDRRDGAGAGHGQLPQGAGSNPGPGPDIGVDLYRLADRADELSAQLRACQTFVGKLQPTDDR